MLSTVQRPEILLARGHHALSCRSLQARVDRSANEDIDSYHRWALAGTLWARKGWMGRCLTVPADVLLGTLRLSEHPWAFGGVLQQYGVVESPRIYLGPFGEVRGPGASPPEERYRFYQKFDALASQLGAVLTFPWVSVGPPEAAEAGRISLTAGHTDQMGRLSTWWTALAAPLDASRDYLARRFAAAQKKADESRYLEPVIHQVAWVTAYVSLLCACAAAAAALTIKATVTASGALLGVVACVLLRPLGLVRFKLDEDLALQGAEDYSELHYARATLSAEQKGALAKEISDERFELIREGISAARTRAPDRGLEAFREQDAVALAAKFREWLSASSELPEKEREALTYFFSSDEGMLPHIWIGRQTKANLGTHITRYLYQRFVECLARREPLRWRALLTEQMTPREGPTVPPDGRRPGPTSL